MYYIDIFILSFFISLLVTPLVKRISLRAGYFDYPNERKVHTAPVSRLGGLGIYAGFVLSFLIVHWLHGIPFDHIIKAILVGSTVIVVIGFIDDIRGVSAPLKLLGQLMVAIITASELWGFGFGIKIEFISNPLSGGLVSLGALSFPLTILWIIGIINAVNLIDGLDGLAAGVSVIASISLFFGALITGELSAALITVALMGSTMGFLRYNYNPASIFMGDTGSMLLGYILAVASIIGVLKSTTSIALAVPILALGIPIYDTVSSVLRRLKNKQPIFQADGQHIHHRLMELGFSHKEVVKIIYFASILLSICSIIMTMLSGWKSLLALMIIGIIIAIGILKIHTQMRGV